MEVSRSSNIQLGPIGQHQQSNIGKVIQRTEADIRQDISKLVKAVETVHEALSHDGIKNLKGRVSSRPQSDSESDLEAGATAPEEESRDSSLVSEEADNQNDHSLEDSPSSEVSSSEDDFLQRSIEDTSTDYLPTDWDSSDVDQAPFLVETHHLNLVKSVAMDSSLSTAELDDVLWGLWDRVSAGLENLGPKSLQSEAMEYLSSSEQALSVKTFVRVTGRASSIKLFDSTQLNTAARYGMKINTAYVRIHTNMDDQVPKYIPVESVLNARKDTRIALDTLSGRIYLRCSDEFARDLYEGLELRQSYLKETPTDDPTGKLAPKLRKLRKESAFYRLFRPKDYAKYQKSEYKKAKVEYSSRPLSDEVKNSLFI